MHRSSRAFIASLLSGLLLASAVSPAFGASVSDYQRARQNAESARKRAAAAGKTADRLASEVAALDKQIESVQAAAAALEPQIQKASARTARIQVEVTRLTVEVDQTQAELEATQAEYERQQKLLADRVQSTYRQGSWFYLDILLGSADIGDLIQRTEFVSRVIESNNALAGELESTEIALSRAKVKLDRSLDSVKLKKREAAEVEASLRGLQEAKERTAAEQEQIQNAKSALVAENRSNAKRLLELAEEEEAESARIAAELARAGQGSGLFAGTMTWPVPASRRITSPFGWRMHPIFGTRRFHAGIDISGNGGTPPVIAAAGGTVIFAGYRGGYGNTIMVDNGNGVVTLYGHLSRIGVSYGQNVTQGMQIGSVGSTGNSTGPHLHFEVRVNGEPRNPMSYL